MLKHILSRNKKGLVVAPSAIFIPGLAGSHLIAYTYAYLDSDFAPQRQFSRNFGQMHALDQKNPNAQPQYILQAAFTCIGCQLMQLLSPSIIIQLRVIPNP